MNTNELMLGDWVRIKDSIDPNDAYWMHDDFHPGQAIRVEEILSNGVNPDWYGGEINDYIPEDAIEPISLTPEILEKNGFYLNGIEDYNNPSCNIDYGKWSYENEDGFDVVGGGTDIKYVHQLQHALRLCGIEKEITVGL